MNTHTQPNVRSSRNHSGFTLIELLVAMFITAVLFAIGYGGINEALAHREALKTRQERLLALQSTMRILVQDFSQLAPRPIREPVGDGWQPALRAGTGSSELVSFTRAGWANPAGIQRPALQRVAYIFEDKTLRRRHWRVLDPTLGSEHIERELLKDVRSVRFRYMDHSRQWLEQWPVLSVPAGGPGGGAAIRPLAVEVTLELEDWGKIIRLIEVPG